MNLSFRARLLLSVSLVILCGVARLVAQADVSIVKTGPATAVAGTNVTYSITVTNNGPNAALAVTTSDTLPANTTLVSFTQNSGPPAGGTLAAGGIQTFTLVVTVNANTANGTMITNTANVSSTTADPTPANNSSVVNTTVSTQADVSIVKTGPATAVAGSNVTYSITVTNNGPSDAQSVTTSDTLPSNTTLVSFTQNSGPPAGGTLAAGGIQTFTLVVTVNSTTPNGTVLTNTANVSSSTADPTPANNTSTVNTTVTTADVSIVKTGPATAAAGSNIAYSITVTNNGPADAQAVTTSDTLPSNTTLVSFTQNSGPPSGGPLPNGATQTFTLVLTVNSTTPEATVLTNTANVSSTTPDPNASNNSSTVNTTVTTADVSVTKVDTPDPVAAGSDITYTITLTNSGPSSATSVSLSDTLPAGTTFTSLASPGGWSCTTPAVGTGGTVSCSNPTLAVGSAVFTLTVSVGSGVTSGTVVTNTATASSATPDPNAANNSATATTTVAAQIPALSALGLALLAAVLAGIGVLFVRRT